MTADPRRNAPAADRNKDAILAVLRGALPADGGRVLEVAAGTGQHAAYFAAALPHLEWLPTDPDPDNRASIDGYRADTTGQVAPARALDVRHRPWPADLTDLVAVVAVNLIHIAPWAVAEALVAEAGQRLGPGGLLFFYGPFTIDRQHTADSNRAFDDSLKARDPSWGVRDVADVADLAAAAGFGAPARTPMPANNQCLFFYKSSNG